MTKIASINLDIRKNSTVDNEPIILRQGDNDVIIEASISNNGYPNIEIDFATFVAKKSDGTIISNDPTNVSGNVISYPISKHLTESVGKIQDAYFMINNQITTCGFDISIIPSAQLDSTSVNYIPGIENINKFLESTEADWLGRIQQMKNEVDGLDVPAEFKLLMDKALSDAKAQYQPIIDAAQENVENIVADLAAKKLDLTNNSDELNKTIAAIQTQVASITSFLDNIQKQIIDANSSFTAGQQAQVSQSIADDQKKLADSIASMQAKVAQSISDLKAKIDALTVAKTGPKGDKGDIGPQGPKGDKGDKGDTGSVDNDGLTAAPAFVNLQTQVDNSAVGTNLLLGTSKTLNTVTNASDWNTNLPAYQAIVKKVNSDTTYTARSWLSPASKEMNIQIVWKDASGNEQYDGGNWISPGTSGYSTWTGTIPAGNIIERVTIVFSEQQSTASIASYCEAKLERGSHATDWCPNPSEIATSGDVQTAITNALSDVNAKVKELETKIDKLSQGKQ